MSKAEWYGNFDCIARKDNYEEALVRKEKLQKKFLEMCAKTNSDDDISVNNKKCLSSFNAKNKDKEINNKDVNILRNEIKRQKKTLLSLKKENEKIKKARFAYIKSCKEKDSEIDTYKKQLAMKIKEIQSLKKENQNLKNEVKLLTNLDINQELKALKNENNKLKQHIACLSGNLKSANKQVQNYQQMRSGEVESSVVRKYKHKLNEKENEIENLKSKYIASTATINMLNGKMLKKKKEYLYKKSEQYKEDKIKTNNSNDNSIDDIILFGFVSLNKEMELIFIDINNKRYHIEHQCNLGDKSKYVGMPARVIKCENNNVKLDYVYYNLSKGAKIKAVNKEKSFKLRKKKSEISVLENEFNGKSILIMCSKNKDKYLSAFKNSGAKILWYDSFSDNESRIEDYTSSSDIVIVCTSHISHGAIYKLQSLKDYKDNNKYQLIENDNVNNIISRVRYAIENTK